MTIDELQVVVTANTSQLKRELASVRGDLNKLDKNTSAIASRMPKHFGAMATVASAFGNVIANVVGGAFRSMGASVGDAVSRLDTIKNYPRVMSNLGISSADATKSIEYLDKKLLGLPTTIDSAVGAVQRFTSANNNIGASTDMFLALNNAILAGGAPMQVQQSALEQLSQSYAKGKPDMMEWRTAMMAMPAQLTQLAKAMGYANSSALGEALREGTVSMDEFMAKLVDLNNNGANGFQSFEQQARNATGGIGTSIVNLKTAITRGIANIMDAIGQANITAFFNGIIGAINATVPYVIAFVKIMMGAVSFISQLFGGKGIAQGDQMTKTVNKTSEAMGGVASGAMDASGAIDSATGSAKKLNKQLAGFDEMNVLTEPTDSGSGGGGGGAGGGSIATPDWGATESGAQSMGDKVKKIMEDLKAGFQAFVSSPFVQGFISVFQVAGVAIVWLYENAIKPVIDWLGGLLTALSENKAVMDVLTPVLTVLGVIAGAFALAIGIVTVALGIWTVITTIATAIGGAFGAVMAFITSPIGLVILAITAIIAIIVLLVKHWDKVMEVAIAVWNGIVEAWNVVAEWFNTYVIQPLIQFFTGLWQGIVDIFSPIVNWFKDKFQLAWLGIQIIWAVAKKYFTDVWNNVKGVFSAVGNFFKGIFEGAWNNVKNAFNSVKSFFDGVWRTITSIFTTIGSTIGNAIGDAFKTVVNSIIGFAENMINGFIRAVNTAIDLINNIPGVDIGKVSELRIPRLAKGGVVDGATMAVIGEAGKEAVMPLENNTGWITELANKINSQGGGSQPQNIIVKIGEDTIVRKVIDGINDLSYQNNEAVITL